MRASLPCPFTAKWVRGPNVWVLYLIDEDVLDGNPKWDCFLLEEYVASVLYRRE